MVTGGVSPHFGLDATVRLAAGRLPALLAPRESVALCADHVASIPASLTDWLYFEVRLDPRSVVAVDLSLRVQAAQREGLRRAVPSSLLGNEPLRSLATWWASPGGGATISQLWLECDQPRSVRPADAAHGPRPPGVFAALSAAARAPETESRCAAVNSVLPHLLGELPGTALSSAVDRAIRALPLTAEVMYVGFFRGRARRAVRLTVTRLHQRECVAFLTRIGWPGNASAFAAELSSLTRFAPDSMGTVCLNLDITAEGVLPRLGLEFAFSRKPQRFGGLPHRPFFDDLVREGVVDRSRCDALVAWPGVSRATLAHQVWPSVAFRCVNHVKLVYEPAEPWLCKAYLAWAHGPMHAATRISQIEQPV
jgi:hypothetical protein